MLVSSAAFMEAERAALSNPVFDMIYAISATLKMGYLSILALRGSIIYFISWV